MQTSSYHSSCYVYVQTAHSCGGDRRAEQDLSTALQLEGHEEMEDEGEVKGGREKKKTETEND